MVKGNSVNVALKCVSNDACDARRTDAGSHVVIGRRGIVPVALLGLVSSSDIVEVPGIGVTRVEHLVESVVCASEARPMHPIPQRDDAGPQRAGEAGASDARPACDRLRGRECRAVAIGVGIACTVLRVWS